MLSRIPKALNRLDWKPKDFPLVASKERATPCLLAVSVGGLSNYEIVSVRISWNEDRESFVINHRSQDDVLLSSIDYAYYLKVI